MTKRQMQAILNLVEKTQRKQIVIINRLEIKKNLELGRLDEEFEQKLKGILSKSKN